VNVLFRKELADHLDSLRFLIIFIMAMLIAGVSLYSAMGGLGDTIEGVFAHESIFLRLFTASNGSIPSFASFVMLIGPLIGLLLGFDAINGERNGGTLDRLLAQPIHRDDVINGKFLAGVAVIAIIMVSMTVLIAGVGLFQIGLPPSGEEVVRIMAFVFFSIVYTSFWLGLAILLSIVSRHAATSALVVIAVWLILTFFMALIVTGLTSALFQADTIESAERALAFQQQFSRVSPSVLYSEAIGTILDPTTRILGITSMAQVEQLSVAVAGVLPLGQSLLLVWPHLIGLIAESLVIFVISYIVFMKQEIRGA